MTPSEIQEVALTGQMAGLPMWSYGVALAASTIGAFLGVYFSQKAKDLATNENFAQVLEQLRNTTHATEQIRAAITSKGWVDQQAWNQKRQIYSDILLHLTRLSGLLGRCAVQFDPPGAENDVTIPKKPYYIEWSKKTAAEFSDVEELMGVASIFLPPDTIQHIESLLSKHLSAEWWCSSEAEYAQEMCKAVHQTREVVIAHAQKALGLGTLVA